MDNLKQIIATVEAKAQLQDKRNKQAKKDALKGRVEATLSGSAITTASSEGATNRKDHLAARVRAALLAAAAADPILDFGNCECGWHNVINETPTGLTASVVWR